MLSFGYPQAAPGGVIAGRRFEVAGLPQWSAAVRRAQAGQGRAKVVCLGDSTTAGFGTAGRAGSWPRQLASLLSGRGGRETNLFSDHNMAGVYDPRIVRGAGWVKNGTMGLGGFFWVSPSTPTPLVFTPQTAWDTFDYYSLSSAAVEVTIGTAAPVALTPAFTTSGSSLRRGRVTVAAAGLTRGAHAVSIQYATGGQATCAGFDCFDAATGIDILNLGVSGWRAGDFTGSNLKTAATLPLIAPDLTIIDVGINDFNQSTPTTEATFKANVQSLVDKAKVTGDVILIIPNDTGGTYNANRAAFAQYLRDVAAGSGLLPPLDLLGVLGSYSAANAAGDMLDTLHPSTQGSAKIAAAVHRCIA